MAGAPLVSRRQIRVIPFQITHANRSFLRFGQGPAHPGGGINRTTRENNLLCCAWFQTRRLKIRPRLERQFELPSWRKTHISPDFSAIDTAAPPRSSVASTSGCR